MSALRKLTRHEVLLGLAFSFIGLAGVISPILAAVNFWASMALIAAGGLALLFVVVSFRRRKRDDQRSAGLD